MQQNFSNPFAWKTLSVERTTGADFYVCIYTQTSTYKKILSRTCGKDHALSILKCIDKTIYQNCAI